GLPARHRAAHRGGVLARAADGGTRRGGGAPGAVARGAHGGGCRRAGPPRRARERGGPLVSRVLFVVPPLVGHVNPTVPLGLELGRRGHDVAWAGLPTVVDRLLPEG